MADADIKDFSKTLPDTNLTVLGVNIDEGTNAANLNDAIRRVLTVTAKGDFGAGPVLADVVNESTADAGVTVDGVLLKDGAVTGTVDPASVPLAFRTITGTSHTLEASDYGKVLITTNAAPVTITIPPDSSVANKIGVPVYLNWNGVGKPAFAAGAGVTIESPGSLLGGSIQFSTIAAIPRATDTWILVGRLG